MDFATSRLIEWHDTTPAHIDRILRQDDTLQWLLTIDVHNPKAWPTLQDAARITAGLATGSATILTDDPMEHLRQADSIFELAHKRRKGGRPWEFYRARRDAHWAIIAPIVQALEGRMFDSRDLGPLVRCQMESMRCSKPLIYRLLRRYWQAGECANALLPHYDRGGAKGALRRIPEEKYGRPSQRATQTGRATGCNVTPTMQQKFTVGTRKFYTGQPDRTLTQAYALILQDQFNIGHSYENGHRIPILAPEDQRPTLRQYLYWHSRHGDRIAEIKAREGERRYNLTRRGVQGTSRSSLPLLGPAQEYQIDATVADVYLVSAVDRSRIIGRPVLYLVMDLYSRLITGFSVSLSGPSWNDALLALENMGTDKVEFCAEFGITIEEADWPSCHIPSAITGDRGEMLSRCADHVASTLHMRISNTPPYRPDWKAGIEWDFALLNYECIHWIPGHTYGRRERGERDCRLDACMTLQEFRRYLIEFILEYNTASCVSDDVVEAAMVAENVGLSPRDLWHWGVTHRSGLPHTETKDALRVALLPPGLASSTREGIVYDGLHYTCPRAESDQWADLARLKGSWSIPMVYDPRTPRHIFLLLDETTPPFRRHQITPCSLAPRDQQYADCDWHDVHDSRAMRLVHRQTLTAEYEQTRVARRVRRDDIVREARSLTAAALGATSNTQRVRDIRQNRQEEMALENAKLQWSIELAATTPAPDQQPLQYDTDTDAKRNARVAQDVAWLRDQRGRRE